MASYFGWRRRSTRLIALWIGLNEIRFARVGIASGARAALERKTIHVQDVLADTEHTYGAKDV